MIELPRFVDGEAYWIIAKNHPDGMKWEVVECKIMGDDIYLELPGIEYFWYGVDDICNAIHIPPPPNLPEKECA